MVLSLHCGSAPALQMAQQPESRSHGAHHHRQADDVERRDHGHAQLKQLGRQAHFRDAAGRGLSLSVRCLSGSEDM